jgi:hypothetical protein
MLLSSWKISHRGAPLFGANVSFWAHDIISLGHAKQMCGPSRPAYGTETHPSEPQAITAPKVTGSELQPCKHLSEHQIHEPQALEFVQCGQL